MGGNRELCGLCRSWNCCQLLQDLPPAPFPHCCCLTALYLGLCFKSLCFHLFCYGLAFCSNIAYQALSPAEHLPGAEKAGEGCSWGDCGCGAQGRSAFILCRVCDVQAGHAAAFTIREVTARHTLGTIHSSPSCALIKMPDKREPGRSDACIPSSH